VLRERTSKTVSIMKTQFGSEASSFLESITSFGEALDAIEQERLRYMPHEGSSWDKVIRWAEGFAAYVCMFHDSCQEFIYYSEEASRMIWSSVLTLLQMGPSHVALLSKPFRVFYEMGRAIAIPLRKVELLDATAEIQRELARAYSDLMELTCAVSARYVMHGGKGERYTTADPTRG
jgi:hypothetical protein